MDLENIKKTYFKMATPVVLGMVVTLIYNLTDTYFISLTQNTNLIAAISLCAPIFTALMAFGNIYGQGGSSLISRLIGKDDKERVRVVSSFCFYVAIITGIILGIIMFVMQDELLVLLGCNQDTISYAKDYYVVLAIGAPYVVVSFIHQNLLRCEGKAKEAMIGAVLGTIANIVLDPILILKLNMGAMGAAIATVIGYIITVVYLLIIVVKNSNYLSVNIHNFMVRRDELFSIFGVGVTAAITNITQSICVLLLNGRLVVYGNDYVAAMGIVSKINMIAQLIIIGYAFGGVPLFGILYGAKNKEKLRELIRFDITFLGGLSLVFTVVLFVFANPLLSLFFKDTTLVSIGIFMLRTQIIGNVFMAIVLVMTVLFQATGKVIPALVMSLSRQGIIYVVVLVLASSLLGYNGILFTQVIADVISTIVGLLLLKLTLAREIED